MSFPNSPSASSSKLTRKATKLARKAAKASRKASKQSRRAITSSLGSPSSSSPLPSTSPPLTLPAAPTFSSPSSTMATFPALLSNVLGDFGLPAGLGLTSAVLPVLSGSGLPSISRLVKTDTIIGVALKMALVGILVALVRQLYGYTKTWIYDSIFITAYVERADPAFDWIRAWMAQDAYAQSQMRVYRLFSSDSRQAVRDMNARDASGSTKAARPMSASMHHHATWGTKHFRGQVMAIDEQPILVWKDGKPIWLTRSRRDFARSPGKFIDHVKVCSFRFHPSAVIDFLADAHRQFYQKTESELLIFHASAINGTWYDPITRPARPWTSVILPPSVKDDVCDDVERFLSDEEAKWYAARGIPHRRGYLLHGKPGAGKTTLATAIATRLRLDVYIIEPGARGMDDAKLSKLFRSCPPGNMILIEDIDCVMPALSRTRRAPTEALSDAAQTFGDAGVEDEDDSSDEEAETTERPERAGPIGKKGGPVGAGGPGMGLPPSTVTLSGLLNAIDGVSSQEDCILFASTNHPKRLDEALTRPGRFDVQVAFGNATPAQATALFKHFYPLEDFPSSPTSESAPGLLETKQVRKGIKDGVKMMTTQADKDDAVVPSATAVARRARAVVSTQEEMDDLALKFTQAVFPSITGGTGTITDVTSAVNAEKATFDHGSQSVIDEKAELDFKLGQQPEATPEATPETPRDLGVSMAALQGYLLRHKTDPHAAAAHAIEWANEVRAASVSRKAKAKRGSQSGQAGPGSTTSLGVSPGGTVDSIGTAPAAEKGQSESTNGTEQSSQTGQEKGLKSSADKEEEERSPKQQESELLTPPASPQ